MSNFNIVDETGKNREACELLCFSFESVKYCLYSVRRDNENYNIFISKLIDHGIGNIELINLEEEKEEVKELVKFIFKNPDVNSLKGARIDVLEDVSLYGVENLLFTTHKTYMFSVKEELYNKVKNAFSNRVNDTVELNINSLMNNNKDKLNTIRLSDEGVNFKTDMSQKINEKDNLLFEGSKSDLDNAHDIIRKINIERLDINNNEDLEKLFVKERIKTPNNDRGFISGNITLLILGILSFVLITILLMLNF